MKYKIYWNINSIYTYLFLGAFIISISTIACRRAYTPTPSQPVKQIAINFIGDSNGEGYMGTTVGVSDLNWMNIVSNTLNSTVSGRSGLGFTDLKDTVRYGITLTGNTTSVKNGPTNSALKMAAGSTITFTSSTDYVELWYWQNPGAGKLEFRRNDTLYRTINADGVHQEGLSSFNASQPVKTSSNKQATYEIKCTGSPVLITALFKTVYLTPSDNYSFLRAAVSEKTFQNFKLSELKRTTGLTNHTSSLYIIALGTNSIYNRVVATSSKQFAADLTSYIDSLRSANSDVVYVMPPRSAETYYLPIIEPYINYHAKADSICRAKGVFEIDLQEINNGLYGTDGLHFSLTGHKLVANYVLSKLKVAVANTTNITQYLPASFQ